jgi:hypothetical protein
MADSPQRHEHGGQNPSMSRPDLGQSAGREAGRLDERSEHAAQPGMREGAEAHQRDRGPAAREQAESRHQPRDSTQTVGRGEERLGRGERGSPNAVSEDRAHGNRAGDEAHQAVQPAREQSKSGETNRENKSAESAKSTQHGRKGQELGQERSGRNERQPDNLTGQNQQQRGQSAEHAAKSQHQHDQRAAQPSRSETPTAQQQGTHPTQTTGEARQHEKAGQAPTRENAGQSQGREQTGQTQTESNRRGQTASTKVNNQQRTQIVDRLRSDRDLERARSDVNIRVNVGEQLPERVRPRPLPSDIVDIVPEYRGYDYTVIHDEIAIVNPETREVVDIIPEHGVTAEGGGSYGGTYAEGGRIVLSRQQREILRHAAFGSATVGSTASSGATCLSLRPVPEELARSNPEFSSYKYLAIGDQVVLVDPHDQKIVQVVNY